MGDQDSSLLNEGSRPFPRLVKSNIVNLCINEFLFQNHWADCNHTWHKWVNGIQCIPVEVYILFPWGDDNAWSTFKILQNHWTNFKQTCHITSFSAGDSSTLKWNEEPTFIQGEIIVTKRNFIKILWKSSSPAPQGRISTKLGTEYLWLYRIQDFF